MAKEKIARRALCIRVDQTDEVTLARVTELTGDPYTKTYKRALRLYALVLAVQENGGVLLLMDEPGAAPQRLRFL